MTNHPNRGINSNHYANTTTEDLQRQFNNLAPRAAPEFHATAADYESFLNCTREDARRRKLIGAELDFRAANPGAYEAEQANKARQKAMFGY